MLDPAECYRAMCARDARFDGVFYVAVSTTGVYCRPICPARTPARTRCEFFARAAEAEKAGYRACFRCRPEVAPGVARASTVDGVASVDARAHLVARAAELVDAGFLNTRSVDELGERLGVSGRHVRRAMEQELGVSPVELAQARRLALAKQLLHDTSLPLTEVALSSGFASVRRFNALFAARFGRPPSAVRRTRGVSGASIEDSGDHGRGDGDRGTDANHSSTDDSRHGGDVIRLRLDYRAPLEWSALLGFLGARAIPGVEHISDDRYRRTVPLDGTEGPKGAAGWIEVGPWEQARTDSSRAARPSLEARVSLSLARDLPRIASRLRALFDLDARPDVIAAHLSRDRVLAPLVAARPGLRVPGAFDPYEMAIRAVLGQQITVRGATTLCGRLVDAFGTPAATGEEGLNRLFPTPARIAALSEDELRSIGLPAARARTLKELSAAVVDGRVDFGGALPEAAIEAMLTLPGIGPWTASYLAMRALRWPDAFAAGDLGVQKALAASNARDAEARSTVWRPWRAYAVMHLWSSLPVPGAANPTKSKTARKAKETHR